MISAMRDRSEYLAPGLIAAFLILTFVSYWPGLGGPLLLDDLPQLNSLIAESAQDAGTLFRNYIVSTSGPLGRPVAMASFIGDAITHGPDIWWWKYDNLMLHGISGLLVVWLTALLLQALPKRVDVNPWLVGAVVAGVWLLHPLHVSTVLYTVQRMTGLSTLFVFAGLVCYLKGRLTQERSAVRGWLLIVLGFFVFFLLAALSKESGLLYPVYCSLIELLILQFRGSGSTPRGMRIFHGVLLAAYAAAGIVVLANFSAVVLDDYATRDFTLFERVLTQFRVLVIYLSLLLVPMQRRMGFFHDDIAVSTGLLSPATTLISALVVIALIATAIVLRRKQPLLAFGVLFYFASQLLESSLFGLELMYEHRNYPGSLGILVALLAVLPAATRYRKVLVVAVAIVLCGLSAMTWQRAQTWSSPGALYDYMARAHPQSPRLNLVYTNVYAAGGDFARARAALARVGPGLGTDLHGLFLDCLERRRLAAGDLAAVARPGDGLVDAHATSSAQVLLREALAGRCDVPRGALLELFDRLAGARSRSDLDRRSVLFTRASLLESMRRIDAAVAGYLSAQELTPDDMMPLYLAGQTLIRAGRLDEARALLVRAGELERDLRIRRRELAQSAYLELGRRLVARGDLPKALAAYADARAALPGRAVFYVEATMLLTRLRRYDEAEALLAEARERDLVDYAEFEYALNRVGRTLDGYRERDAGE